MKKPVVFLAAAVVLLGLAAFLMPSTDPAAIDADGSSVPVASYPTGPTAADRAKIEARKTLDAPEPAPTPAPAPTDGTAPAPAPTPQARQRDERDAVMVALPPSASDVFVMEAQTFLARPAVRGVAQCLAMQGVTFPVESLGLRVADLDRVAIADLGDAGTLAVVTGDMSKLDVGRLLKNAEEQRYGENGRIFATAGVPPEEQPKLWNVGRFRDSLALIGRPRAVVEQALDRLEGRTSSEVAFPESERYGDAYGRVSAMSLRRVFPADLADKLAAANLLAQFHIDSRKDVMISADAQGDPEASQALGKATAAALAAKRVEAAQAGDKAMVKLLDTFRVRTTPHGFLLQAGFTEAYLQKQLGDCMAGGKPSQ